MNLLKIYSIEPGEYTAMITNVSQATISDTELLVFHLLICVGDNEIPMKKYFRCGTGKNKALVQFLQSVNALKKNGEINMDVLKSYYYDVVLKEQENGDIKVSEIYLQYNEDEE